ncbi:hypothetical protein ABL78_3341 [Leptomonas seymouri]|uniref:Uncharacterized protein n=1 Tax=Leptomonas seymouri TaxID=5684 RepID=A0A0N1HZP6_LEPSE|nr:hypothetical protein ABL78_3341 [Leptomonas seymouri]|eukprot:KPI87590.1 hypothetical protein ABL78_3341 [Leptomonas seymouri]
MRRARSRRRANQQNDGGASSGPSAAVTSHAVAENHNTPSGTAATATLPSSRRNATMAREEAQRLSQRMQQQRQDKTKVDQLLSQRESLIQERYAPGTAIPPLPRGATAQQQQQAAAAAMAAAAAFDKDEVLASLIADSKANFLKLDHDLTEDHTIATRRLHNSVFANANSFLLLFRDVDRASDLVEALKANVQGTKAAISSTSKYSSANIVTNSTSAGGAGEAATPGPAGVGDARTNVFSSALSSTMGEGDPRRLARPSLVTRRITYRSTSGGGSELTGEDAWWSSRVSSSKNMTAIGASSTRATTWASTLQRSGVEEGTGTGVAASFPADTTAANRSSDDGGGGAADAALSTGAARPTTHSLNVSSVRQWRYAIGLTSVSPATTAAAVASASSADRADTRGDGSSDADGRRLSIKKATAKSANTVTAAAKAEKEAAEAASLVDIVREEVSQLLTERRHVDAAELLYRLAGEATAKGCLPFLLDLEAALVRSVITSVVKIPVTPMFVESLHIPLVQLLLRFGRSRSAAAVYLSMQTPWLHSEVRKLQSRVNPQHASLIAVDYLVRVTRATVRRQHTLGLGLDAAQPIMADPTAAASSTAREDSKRKAGAAAAAAAGKLIPPNAAALLWVRRNVEHFACDVLATHLLSFGTGTDGDDPTRIRQAAQMISQTSRVMQTLSAEGFSGCDTLILRQLTPTLVILEDDFTRLTAEKIEHGGRAMMEQLIMGSLVFYELNDANTSAIAAAAEATASYAAAVARLSTSPPAQATPAAGGAIKKNAKGAAEAGVAGPKMPLRPPPLHITPPYVPSKCDDVARKVRVQCQEIVQVVRTFPLSGHSLLIQMLLAPASSSLFSSSSANAGGGASSPLPATSPRRAPVPTASANAAAGGGRAGAGRGGAPPSQRAAATAPPFNSLPPPPPLSAEVFRFLRYANGCSSTQIRLLQSLCGYVAALTGTTHLPAEVMASAAAQEQEGANSAAATAMREQQSECVAHLLRSAMVTESMDVVLCSLFTTMLSSLLRQRRALVRYLSSDAFRTHHRRSFPLPTDNKVGAASDRPLFSDPANAPGWVMDGTLSLLSDVLGTGVWISYFTCGGAMAHMLADAEFGFRTQHLERVQREVPRLVQGWMCAALLLSSDVTHANAVLAPARGAAGPSTTPRAPPAASPLLAPPQSVLFGARAPERSSTGGANASAFSSTALASKRVTSNMSFTAVAAAATAAAAQTAMSAARKDAVKGIDAASVLLSIPVISGSGAAAETTAGAANATSGAKDVATPVTKLFTDAGVREERLLRFTMTLLDRKYCTPAGFTAHMYVIDSATTTDSATGVPCGVWAVRQRISSYPEFPIGDVWPHRKDEVFLFHWCAQISLHLITLFQERLVTPSATINQRAADAQGNVATFLANGLPFPIQGCIKPPEDTVLAGWCAGGGNYITAIALLQFLVMRLLRDGLCRAETWSAVYDCPLAQWRADESVLRQQLFFFALFLYLWAPLFTGGRVPRPRTAAADGSAGDAAVSSFLVDGLPPIAVLEWMTCGGVLSPGAGPNFVDTAMATAVPGRIPPSLTAIDVLFGTGGPIHLAAANRERAGIASSSRSGASAGGAAAWKAKVGGNNANTPTTAAEGATSFATAGMSANTVLAKRDLFGPGASFIPDSLLRVARCFFEEQLGESRAIPAMTSDMMRNRVEKAAGGINVMEFVGTSLGAGDDSESDDASATSSVSTSTARSGKPTPSQKMTLQDLRDLIATYARPIS